MLLSTPRLAQTAPRPRTPGRRRGAQPGNHNALRHGIYAASSRLPPLPTRGPLPSTATFPQSNVALLQAALLGADRIMSNALDLMQNSRHPNFGLGCNAYSAALGLFARISILKFRLALPMARLVQLSQHVSPRIDWEFRRLTERPAFVPLTVGNSDANSSNPDPVLTDAQWLLLKDLFRSLRAELDARRHYKRHKPLPDDRRLLRAILLKLAFGRPWSDLRTAGFNPRMCRQLYRRLCRSGRMSAIYIQLHRDVLIHGGTRLQELVQQGCLEWHPNHISLAPGQPLTWQKFTALLLLQRAQLNQRALARKSALLRRRRAAFLRYALSR